MRQSKCVNSSSLQSLLFVACTDNRTQYAHKSNWKRDFIWTRTKAENKRGPALIWFEIWYVLSRLTWKKALSGKKIRFGPLQNITAPHRRCPHRFTLNIWKGAKHVSSSNNSDSLLSPEILFVTKDGSDPVPVWKLIWGLHNYDLVILSCTQTADLVALLH